MDALYLLGHALLIGAPSGIHPVGASEEYGLYTADLAIFNLEQLRDLPGPVDLDMIKKAESEGNSAFAVYRDVAAVADA